MCTPYDVYLIERCFLSMIAFKLTTRLKGKGTPTKAFGKYCFRSINDVRVGGARPPATGNDKQMTSWSNNFPVEEGVSLWCT